MALDAGVMSITLEFAKDLKDTDWFGKQDPYCIVKVGGQTFRTRTARDGGRNPVWQETFRANIINENSVDVEVKDDDIGRDDTIGVATFTLARARQAGSDRVQVPVASKRSRKQHGFISVALKWEPNRPPSAYAAAPTAPLLPQQYAQAPQYAYPAYTQQAPPSYHHQQQPHYAPPPPAPYAMHPPPAHYPPAAAYPPPAYAAYPPPTGPHSIAYPGAPPPAGYPPMAVGGRY